MKSALIAMFVTVIAMTIDAAEWTGGGDGTSWEDPLNWSTEAVPGTGDDVRIDADGVVVTATAAVAIQSLEHIDGGLRCLSSFTSQALYVRGGEFDASGCALTISGDMIVSDSARVSLGGTTLTILAGGELRLPPQESVGPDVILDPGKAVIKINDIVQAESLHIRSGGLDMRTDPGDHILRLTGSGRSLVNDSWIRGWAPNGGKIYLISDDEQTVEVCGGYGGSKLYLQSGNEHNSDTDGHKPETVARFEQVADLIDTHTISTMSHDGRTVEWKTNGHLLDIDVFISLGNGGKSVAGTHWHLGESSVKVGNFLWSTHSGDRVWLDNSTLEVPNGFYGWRRSSEIYPGTSTVIAGGDLGVPWLGDDRVYPYHNLVVEGDATLYGTIELSGSLTIAPDAIVDPRWSEFRFTGHTPHQVDLNDVPVFGLRLSGEVLISSNVQGVNGSYLAIQPGLTIEFDRDVSVEMDTLFVESDPSRPITLGPTEPGGLWALTVNQADVVKYADITGSDSSSGTTIEARHSIDGGNNLNWRFTDSLVLSIDTPSFSYTSPAWVEGRVSADAASVEVDGFDATLKKIDKGRWYVSHDEAGVVLQPDTAVNVSVTASNNEGLAAKRDIQVEWVPIDLLAYGPNTMTVRTGDSLLLTSKEKDIEVDSNGDGIVDLDIKAGDLHVWTPELPGIYQLSAMVNGEPTGDIVQVAAIEIVKHDVELAVEIEYTRTLNFEVLPAEYASAIYWEPLGRTELDVLDIDDGEGSVSTSFRAHSLYEKTGVLPRINGADGAALAAVMVNVFDLWTTGNYRIIYDKTLEDGRMQYYAEIHLRPYVSDIEIRGEVISSGVTFENDSLLYSRESNDLWELNTGIGFGYYKIRREPGADITNCHRFAPFQEGLQIGEW